MTKFFQIILFIILAIPGALLSVFSSIAILGKIFDPNAGMPSYDKLLLAFTIGTLAALIGLGKLKKWAYSLVFIVFPLSFFVWALINPNMIGGMVAMLTFVVIAVFGTLKAVRHYYRE